MKQRSEGKMGCVGPLIWAVAGLTLMTHECKAQAQGAFGVSDRGYRDSGLTHPVQQDEDSTNVTIPEVGYNTTTQMTDMEMQFRSEQRTPNIVNGQPSSAKEFPIICTLQRLFNGFWFFICGATIMNEHTLITAAHCVNPGGEYRVICGHSNLVEREPGEVIKRILDMRIHPDFDLNPMHGFPNDIALLKVESPLEFGGQINALEIHDGVMNLPRFCYIIGWGVTEDGQVSLFLRKARMRRISNRQCKRRWAIPMYPDPINSGHFCVLTPRATIEQPSSACFGDSGGPLVCGRFLVGISSWGSSSCNGNFPNVYTRLNFFKCWIKDNMFY